ncbi:sigma-54 dependent transcriptional regulator [Opitutaceae bacterium]|nr:sigma-54 dependent transcriptional regulator [Opitutaceae bacterium]
MRLDNSTLLLVEDEALLRRRLAAKFEAAGAEVAVASDLGEARRLAAEMSFDFVLMDVNLPDGRSPELLEEKIFGSSTVVLIMTSEGGVEGAVEAIRLGAADYLPKPVDADDAMLRMASARKRRRRSRGDKFKQEKETAQSQSLVFGESLQKVRLQLDQILSADGRLAESGTVPPPVIILGDTGTGKTSLARWLHHHGPRAAAPLIEVNCSALPEALAESELFGHERGAFTDAKEAKIGLFEAAEGGTLFLDELPSLSLPLQSKLLKVIEDREVRRVGGHKSITVDVRVVAAAQDILDEQVATGAFREDLRQRLDLFRVNIPALRERGDDVVVLAQNFADDIARKYGLGQTAIPAEGAARLRQYGWPGNVRELAHEVERSLVFGDDQLLFTNLEQGAPASAPDYPWLAAGFRFPEEGGFDLENTITTLVKLAVDQADGNASAAARLLGVPRDFVRYRLKQAKD